jgi:hypothetical protein
MAGKPWPEHNAPWGDGDPDGEDKGAYQVPPGEMEERAPRKPDGDEVDA